MWSRIRRLVAPLTPSGVPGGREYEAYDRGALVGTVDPVADGVEAEVPYGTAKRVRSAGRLDDILAEIPYGFVERVGTVLEGYAGKEHAASKAQLMESLKRLGFGVDLSPATFERQVRLAIVALRKRGALICSSSGDGGYYLAANREEYDEFVEREYKGKIVDMQETVDAMNQAARSRWGEGLQMGLF
jgi:hypothetical protein